MCWRKRGWGKWREESFELRLTNYFLKDEVRFHENLRNPGKKDKNKMMKNTVDGRSTPRYVRKHDTARKQSDGRSPWTPIQALRGKSCDLLSRYIVGLKPCHRKIIASVAFPDQTLKFPKSLEEVITILWALF